MHSCSTSELFTPLEYVDATREVMGEISLDPACSRRAATWVEPESHFDGKTRATNGLTVDWFGRVLANPPSRALIDGELTAKGMGPKLFWRKLIEEWQAERIEEAIWIGYSLEQLLSLQRSGTEVYPFDFPVCIPRSRMKFVNATTLEPEKQPTHGNYIPYIGEDVDLFVEVFSRFGKIVLP